METTNELRTETAAQEFSITRVFEAPRALVFSAWAEAAQLTQWWGPKGLKLGVEKLEFRPGGTFHYSMQLPDGAKMWGKFVYREIVQPERIVFVNSFSDADGNITRAPFSENWPLEMLNILTLTEQDGKTTLTLRGGPLNATEAEQTTYREGHESMRQGFGGTLDQLADHLAKTQNDLNQNLITANTKKMGTKIFVNLPVKNLNQSVAFFTQLGFNFNAQFTDEKATCMIISEDIFVMLLVEDFFKTFTKKPIADATKSTEVILALSAESREAVDKLVNKAFAAGATASNFDQDQGFMYGRSFQDLDGHLWEVMYMDPNAIEPA